MFIKKITDFDDDKILSMYQSLAFKLENAVKTQDKCRIYSEILGLAYVSKKSFEGMKKIKPSYYDEYMMERRKEITNYFLSLNDLTRELCYYWAKNLRSLINCYLPNGRYQRFDKESFFSQLKCFFDVYFPLEGEEDNLFKGVLNKSSIKICQSPFGSVSEIVYLDDLQEALMRIIYNGQLNEHVLSEVVHELGHYYIKNIFYKCGQDKLREKSILTEVIPNYFEFEVNSFCNQYDDIQKISKLIGQYRETRVLDLWNYFSFNSIYNDHSCLGYARHLNIIASMYGDIISLILSERKKSDIFKFQEDFEYLCANVFTGDPFEVLKQIGVRDKTLVETAKNAKQLILSK